MSTPQLTLYSLRNQQSELHNAEKFFVLTKMPTDPAMHKR